MSFTRFFTIALVAGPLAIAAATPANAETHVLYQDIFIPPATLSLQPGARSGPPDRARTRPSASPHGDPDRPLVIGNIYNASAADDLPAPPTSIARPNAPSTSVNRGLTKFSSNIGSHLKSAPRRPKAPKLK